MVRRSAAAAGPAGTERSRPGAAGHPGAAVSSSGRDNPWLTRSSMRGWRLYAGVSTSYRGRRGRDRALFGFFLELPILPHVVSDGDGRRLRDDRQREDEVEKEDQLEERNAQDDPARSHVGFENETEKDCDERELERRPRDALHATRYPRGPEMGKVAVREEDDTQAEHDVKVRHHARGTWPGAQQDLEEDEPGHSVERAPEPHGAFTLGAVDTVRMRRPLRSELLPARRAEGERSQRMDPAASLTGYEGRGRHAGRRES